MRVLVAKLGKFRRWWVGIRGLDGVRYGIWDGWILVSNGNV